MKIIFTCVAGKKNDFGEFVSLSSAEGVALHVASNGFFKVGKRYSAEFTEAPEAPSAPNAEAPVR